MKNLIKVISVVGPTASGKTKLSVELAKRLNGEIVSADSMQIYKGMQIATAKPDEEEKSGVIHHLMDFLPPDFDTAYTPKGLPWRRTIPSKLPFRRPPFGNSLRKLSISIRGKFRLIRRDSRKSGRNSHCRASFPSP